MTVRFDDISIETLREAGGVKWSHFPGKVGAFIAEMDFGTAPAIVRALHAAVDEATFGYLPRPLAERMSQACADWCHTRYGWDIPPANVRPLADVIAGLVAAIEHFSRPGSPIIVPTPAYMPFLVVPRELGREIIQVPLVAGRDGRWSYDLDALDAAFRAGGHLMILCNPHNPVGRVLTRAEMIAIAEVVERYGGRVFADEIHAPLVFPGHRHVPYASISPATAGHAVTATSASKAWNLPGLKCAQLILSNEADLETWSAVGAMAEHGASTLGVVANIAAFTAGGEWLDELLGYLDGSRALLGDLLAEHLPEVGYAQPEGTYLAWLDCRQLGLGDRPAEFFLDRAGVAMTDGELCGAAGRGFVRYTFATPRPIMRQSIEAMARALARHRTA
ncbi:MAG: aminotransferase class I/II-fold pyridoxal phosphate-dependent enzyme [Micromonosporaceae bacterium]|jgi:cystathionine beta-lyase|nr:aminotransferase class I/II-fold pyridoxal phosphate-dependent enzyme [Micromonosporaceae bacterium]